MKGFEAGIEIVIAILLAIIVLVFHVHQLFSGEVQTGGSGYIKEQVRCKTNSDCSIADGGTICIIINNGPRFCGCLDNYDCGGDDCIYNVCT